jgi:hypothetical protein
LFETNEFTGEVGVVRDSFYQNQQNPKAQKRKTVIGTENRCMVMCCSKKVFVSLCNIYRKSAYTLAVKSRERKEKLVLFRASRIEVEPKETDKNLS